MITRLLNRAIELLNAGEKEDARRLLLIVLENDPQNGMAQLLYLDTFDIRQERAQVLAELIRSHALRESKKSKSG